MRITPTALMLGLLKLNNIIKLKTALLISKINSSSPTIPRAFQDILTSIDQIHEYNTRHSSHQNYTRPQIRTNFGKFSFTYTASIIWENIPYDIKCLPYKSFKERYMSFLLNEQTSD